MPSGSGRSQARDRFGQVVPSRQPTTPRLVGRSGLRGAIEVRKVCLMIQQQSFCSHEWQQPAPEQPLLYRCSKCLRTGRKLLSGKSAGRVAVYGRPKKIQKQHKPATTTHTHDWVALPDSHRNAAGVPTEYRCAVCRSAGRLYRNGKRTGSVKYDVGWIGPAGLGGRMDLIKKRFPLKEERLTAAEVQNDLAPTTDYGKVKTDAL